MLKALNDIPFRFPIMMCLLLGLAPYTPEPHIWEKLKMLAAGDLTRPIDIFDFVMHGAPWAVLLAKIVAYVITPKGETEG